MNVNARAALLAVCAVLAVVGGYTGIGHAAPAVLGHPGGSARPWPFSPRQARLVMLMDKAHPAKSSDGRQMWAVTADLTYTTHAGDRITVPKGMVTDLASVPRLVQNVVPSDGDYAQAALVHDFIYKSSGKCVLWKGRVSTCTRKAPYVRAEADDILDQAMADIGVPTWQRWTIWSGVRVGGSAGWNH